MELAVHHHATKRKVVVLGEMPGESQAGEEVMTFVLALTIVILILVSLLVVLLTLTTTLVTATAESDISIGIKDTTGVIDITTGIPSPTNISTSTQRTIITTLTVTLQHDIDNTSRALRRIFRRGIIDDLDTLNALRRNLLQDLRTVFRSESTCLTIDPYLHARVTTQGYLTIRRHLDTGDILQQVSCRTASGSQYLVDREHLTVDLQFHL